MYYLENDLLKITFKERSGELASLFDKKNKTEFMWQADPNVWAWHAPILFPIVGGLKNDTLFVDGAPYSLARHGFFRNSIPEVEEHSQRHIVFLLKSSAQTKAIYPYDFECRIRFDLKDKSLTQRYIVTNTDTKPLFFALGGHPAFKVPFFENENYSDYFVEFEKAELLEASLLSKEGLFLGKTKAILLSGNKLPLSYSLFSNDALVFKSLESRSACIRSVNHSISLEVSFPNFPYLGLWARPNADFLCIEPWIGCADSESGHKDINEKEMMQDIEPGEVFDVEFVISIKK